MNYSLTTVSGLANTEDALRNQTLGTICQLAAESPFHSLIQLKFMVERLRLPLDLGQIKIFYNDFGQCMGYIIWAYLCPAVERRILRSQNVSLYDFEWNEGNSPWIIDLFLPNGSVKHAMAEMRDSIFIDSKNLSYYRIKNGKLIFKRVSRDSISHFWRS
jgi:hemolysin-activating ACP:hemolysin acyltransferase